MCKAQQVLTRQICYFFFIYLHNNVHGLLNTKTILVEGYMSKRDHAFRLGISPKVNVTAITVFEHVHNLFHCLICYLLLLRNSYNSSSTFWRG